MNGSIKERMLKSTVDSTGRRRENVRVYDIFYRIFDPEAGRRKSTCKRGFRTKKEAEAFLLQINNQQNEGTLFKTPDLTVKEYMQDWLKMYVQSGNLKKTTQSGYARIVEKRIIAEFGQIKLKELTVSQIERFYSKLLQSGRSDGKGGLAAKSVLYVHRVLSEALSHAVKKKLIHSSPANDVTNVPKPKKHSVTTYNEAQLLKLIRVSKGTMFEIPILLAGIYGMRRGEILGLYKDEVDFDNNLLHIKRQLLYLDKKVYFDTPKSQESVRTIYLLDIVVDALQENFKLQEYYKNEAFGAAYHENDLVVCYPDGRPINPGSFTSLFKTLLKKNDLPVISFHDLRHASATLMAAANVPLTVAAAILGHSSIAVTAGIYTHVKNDMKMLAAKQVKEHLFKNSEI